MAQLDLRTLLPDAPVALCEIIDSSRGAVQAPIRSEIFGPQRFAQHGRSLGVTHQATCANIKTGPFFPRLQDNISVLREAYAYIGAQASTGYDISPAAEWLLDNFHLIDAQLEEINAGLPKSYFVRLPMLLDEPLAGLPRIYGVAWAFVAHTDGAFDEDLLTHFLDAYQETRELNLSEMWALPTTLRVVLIENLRRLAERVATNKAAREVANLCCDHIEDYSEASLDSLLNLLNRRGVGRVFLGQMGQRLRDRRATGDQDYGVRYHRWLEKELPDVAVVLTQQIADQAADNLSVSNAVNSLRDIGHADWTDIVARTSSLMRVMLTCNTFQAESVATRDQTLHEIERISRKSDKSELSVARILVNLTRRADNNDGPASVAPGHWLFGPGRAQLLDELGWQNRAGMFWRRIARHAALPAYLSTVLFGTVGLVAWILVHRHVADTPGWLVALGVAAMCFPASEAVVALINRLVSESAHPRQLPRLAFADGIPPEHRVLVVVPAMLTSEKTVRDLVHRLELHYLANPELHSQFALLTDWADAETPQTATDVVLLDDMVSQLRQLNARHPRSDTESGLSSRFIVLHRERVFSATEQRWIGWERKRGKLQQLISAIAEKSSSAFLDLGDVSRIADAAQYVVTLDSDTQLPPGRLRELVGIAAHPQNIPCFDSSGTAVVSGYGIFQPRVATPLPEARDLTLFHWLFAGQCGIDPYSAASSEVYQDIFSEGTFTGKGLLNVRAMHGVLSTRIPENQVLSHDLLEGALARCASTSDITLIEDAPFHADVATSRLHRWTRGDWQLLPLLLGPMRHRFTAINRWKMFDNLRRSLVAPISLALLLLALSGQLLSAWTALALVTAAFLVGPLIGAVAACSPSRDDISLRYFYRLAAVDLLRTFAEGAWHLAQLLQHAVMSLDAIARTLYRMAISRRHLLQWTTASAAQSQAKSKLTEIVLAHWNISAIALLIFISLRLLGSPYPVLSATLCLIWAASPVWIWLVSRRRLPAPRAALPKADIEFLEGVARSTWRLFEFGVTREDNYLPPDNVQMTPHEIVAHRTSPTNIGLYLLSVACARRFGWIGTQDLLARIEATLSTLAKMRRYRGHFLNWYDTRTLEPLLPMYVSTVDSGNLSGHLLATAQACLQLAEEPYSERAGRHAAAASLRRLAPLFALREELLPGLDRNAAVIRLLNVSVRFSPS